MVIGYSNADVSVALSLFPFLYFPFFIFIFTAFSQVTDTLQVLSPEQQREVDPSDSRLPPAKCDLLM